MSIQRGILVKKLKLSVLLVFHFAIMKSMFQFLLSSHVKLPNFVFNISALIFEIIFISLSTYPFAAIKGPLTSLHLNHCFDQPSN
jgi:hypothetical protein